jgi:hypothetical protein
LKYSMALRFSGLMDILNIWTFSARKESSEGKFARLNIVSGFNSLSPPWE